MRWLPQRGLSRAMVTISSRTSALSRGRPKHVGKEKARFCRSWPSSPEPWKIFDYVLSARREAPVILTVDAAAMHAASLAFYQAANGIWLTDHVPPGYLSGWPARAGSRRTRPFHARGS